MSALLIAFWRLSVLALVAWLAKPSHLQRLRVVIVVCVNTIWRPTRLARPWN